MYGNEISEYYSNFLEYQHILKTLRRSRKVSFNSCVLKIIPYDDGSETFFDTCSLTDDSKNTIDKVPRKKKIDDPLFPEVQVPVIRQYLRLPIPPKYPIPSCHYRRKIPSPVVILV